MKFLWLIALFSGVVILPVFSADPLLQQDKLFLKFQDVELSLGNPMTVKATSGEKGAGVMTPNVAVQAGKTYEINAEVRGNATIQLTVWGNNFPRKDLKFIKANEEWVKVSVKVTAPEGAKNMQCVFFSWKNASSVFEIKDFSVTEVQE